MRVKVEVLADTPGVGIGMIIANADGLGIAEVGTNVEGENGAPIRAGQTVEADLLLENDLLSGRYFVHCGVNRTDAGAEPGLYVHNAADFVVFGNDRRRGLISIPPPVPDPDRGRFVAMSAPSPELRTVRGPSAIGGGRRRFFDLLWLMSVTEWRRTYFGTILGYLWSLIRPLAFFGVLLFVFTQVFKIGSAQAEYYPVLLLTGTT